MKTILIDFNAKDLPAWTRKHQNVIHLCKMNLAFRVNVHDAKTEQMQRQLIAESERHTQSN